MQVPHPGTHGFTPVIGVLKGTVNAMTVFIVCALQGWRCSIRCNECNAKGREVQAENLQFAKLFYKSLFLIKIKIHAECFYRCGPLIRQALRGGREPVTDTRISSLNADTQESLGDAHIVSRASV